MRKLDLPRSIRTVQFVTLAIMLLAFVARLVPGPRTIDDAFITFRYARNLVHGVGFVYNPGERVLGTTTPLYTVLMATLAFVTRSENYPILALVVNAAADAASVYLLYHLGKRLSNSPLVGWAVGLLWALSPMSVTFAIGGMETSVFILIVLAALVAHLDHHDTACPILLGLAFLARPDALILVALIGGQAALETLRTRDIKRLLGWALLLALTVAPWILFATLYFGSPLPHSVSAKSLAYRLPPEAALGRFVQLFSVPFFESGVMDLWGLARLVIYLTLLLIAALRAFRQEARSLPFFGYPLLYTAVFSAANPLIFRWYLTPPLPGLMLGILLGVYFILRSIPRPVWGRVALAGLTAILAVTSLRAWTLHPDHGPDRPAPEMAFIKLELLYHQAAAQVAPDITRDSTVAAGDIGVLGYDTNARILDTLGLISPQTLRYYPLDAHLYVINYAVAPGLIAAEQPDWLIAPEVYLRRSVLPDPGFSARYELFRSLDTDIYGSQGLLILKRK